MTAPYWPAPQFIHAIDWPGVPRRTYHIASPPWARGGLLCLPETLCGNAVQARVGAQEDFRVFTDAPPEGVALCPKCARVLAWMRALAFEAES